MTILRVTDPVEERRTRSGGCACKLAVFACAAVVCMTQAERASYAQNEIDLVEGITALMMLSALAKSAAASAHASKDSETYSYKDGLGARENAVSACIHGAFRNFVKTGGKHLRLDEVGDVNALDNEAFEVDVKVTKFGSSGGQMKKVTCVVQRNRVKKLLF